MRTNRRIEISAFRRSVTIVSGTAAEADFEEQPRTNIFVEDAERRRTIELGSEEGRRLVIETIRLLEEHLFEQTSKRPHS